MRISLVKNVFLVGLLMLYVSEANSGLLGSTYGFISGLTTSIFGIPTRLLAKQSAKSSAPATTAATTVSTSTATTATTTPSPAVVQDYSTCGILQRYGYDCESHKVTTDDGYILTMFRVLCPKANIPETTSKPVAFLMHGLLASSTIWTLTPEFSLAMTMCDQGYDVWLGNARGNEYSSEHVVLNTSSPNFYMFSWAEIAAIDLPAMMRYALTYTKQDKLSYVGHSQGTTVFFALASSDPTLAESLISSAHLLAPIAFTTNWGGLLSEFTPLLGVPDANSSFVEVELSANILPLVDNLKGKTFCADIVAPQRVCIEIYDMLFGVSAIANQQALQEILKVFPSSASTRQLKHFLQEQTSTKFRLFDFGEDINLAKYTSVEPPQYPLEAITVPTYLYYSDKDLLSPVADVSRVISLLNPNTLKEAHFLPGFHHPDCFIANNVGTILYSVILKNIENLKNASN